MMTDWQQSEAGKAWRKRYQQEWYQKNRERQIALAQERYEVLRIEQPEKIRESNRRVTANLRRQMIDAYGGRCVCCEETRHEFLTLDHVNRDAKQHKAEIAARTARKQVIASDLYRDLRQRGWPRDGYRLLCMNCNWATRFGQSCPHEVRDAAFDLWAAQAIG